LVGLGGDGQWVTKQLKTAYKKMGCGKTFL
jgi:hypothetical protein